MRYHLLEHPRSFHKQVPWLPRRWGLVGIATVFALVNLVLIITLIALGHYSWDYYTYWNFLLITLLCGIVAVGSLVQGWFFSLALGIFLPLVFGSVILVVLIILIVVAIDDTVYVGGTLADPDVVKPQYTFREIRTGDWVMHGLPVAELAILLLFDLQLVYRAILFHWERSDAWTRRAWIWLWNYVSPMLLLLLYSLIFDPTEKYTDKLSLGAGLGIAFGLDLVIMTMFMFAMRLDQTDEWTLPMLYPDVLISSIERPHTTATEQPRVMRGTMTELTAPRPLVLRK